MTDTKKSVSFKNPHTNSRFFKPTPEVFLEVFNDTRNLTEEIFGLRLSTIELYHLRRIANDIVIDTASILQNAGNIRESCHVVEPWKETQARFLLEFYGISPTIIDLWEEDYAEELKEYLRRKQAEYHMP